jgi:hypothetical protein
MAVLHAAGAAPVHHPVIGEKADALSQPALNRPIEDIDACDLHAAIFLSEAWHQTRCSDVNASMYRFCCHACRPQSKFSRF